MASEQNIKEKPKLTCCRVALPSGDIEIPAAGTPSKRNTQ